METGIFQQVANLETLTANGLSGRAAAVSTGLYGFWYHPCSHFHGEWQIVMIYNDDFQLKGPISGFGSNYMGHLTVDLLEITQEME